MLATASDDASVRIWEIPQGGIQEDIQTEQQKFTGHSRKVGLLCFSPTVAEVIASAAFDNTVNVWNICNSTSYSKFSFGDGILSLDWNSNGSLLGLTTKEKMVYIADPRNNAIVSSTKAHESGKTSKMAFLTGEYLFTCGFSKSNERQIKLFDARNFTEAVQTVPVDTQTGVMLPFFDADTGLIFIPGRGEGNVKYFDFSNDTIKSASEYRSSTPQKGIANFPKRAMNYNKCEVARLAKLTNNTVEYLSFYVPKRNEGYDASVYPECFAGEPALKTEEWLSGINKDVIRKNITTLENNFNNTVNLNYEKKESVTVTNSEVIKVDNNDHQNKVNLFF